MTKEQKIIVSVVAAVVVVGAVGYYTWRNGSFDQLLKYGSQGGEEKIVQTPEGEMKGIEVADGTNLITEGGKVIDVTTGKQADNTAAPGAPSAPQQSNPVAKKDIPASVIKISASSAGFLPNSFEVRAGAAVSVSVTSEDGKAYVFAFRDASLKGVAVGVGPGDPTRVISFNAPTAKGEYAYYSNIPSQANLPGFQGKMIVK